MATEVQNGWLDDDKATEVQTNFFVSSHNNSVVVKFANKIEHIRTGRKEWTTKVRYTILTVYYALDLFVSFKLTYIDFTLVIDMLALSAVLIFSIVNSFIQQLCYVWCYKEF